MFETLLSIKNSVSYKRRFKECNVALTASIAGDVDMGERVMVGPRAAISNSHLGPGTTVHSCTILSRVKTEGNVALYDYGRFSGVDVGHYSYIANRASVEETRIGRFCSIGPALICGSGDHPVDWVSTSPVFFSMFKQCGISFAESSCYEEKKEIVVGHDVWIGASVFIRDGVSIGNGAIVGAGAVVVKDVPDYAIVAGVPARIVRYRFDDKTIQRLLQLQWWNWSEAQLRTAQPAFVQGNVQAFINRFS